MPRAKKADKQFEQGSLGQEVKKDNEKNDSQESSVKEQPKQVLRKFYKFNKKSK